jgi:hypothetical protein
LAIVCRFSINAQNHAAILEGIERHQRGENAIDPLTKREIAPPSSRAADEASGWFLDYFSRRELERFLIRGPRAPRWDVWRAAAAPLAVCVTTGDVAWRRMVATADPGAIASLAVVASGFSFALLLFHLVRIGPARRLASGAIPNEVVGAHLLDCRRGHV